MHCGHANTVHKWKQCGAVMDFGHGGVVPLPFSLFKEKYFFASFLSNTNISHFLPDASVTVLRNSVEARS